MVSDRQVLRPDVVRSARIVSAYRGITMAEYLSEVHRPIGNVPGGLRAIELTPASPDHLGLCSLARSNLGQSPRVALSRSSRAWASW